MQPDLRPLSFGEILDGAFTLYRRNFLRFLACTLLPTLALAVVGAVVAVSAVFVIGAFGSGWMALLIGALVLTVLTALAMVMWGALAWAAACAYTGKKTTLGDCLEAGGRTSMTMVGVLLIGAVLVTAGVMVLRLAFAGVALVLGGVESLVVLGVATAVATVAVLALVVLVASLLFAALPAAVMEELGPAQAVWRSMRLASGSVGRIAGTMLVTLVIAYLPIVAIGVATGAAEALYDPQTLIARRDGVVETLLGWAANALVSPFVASVIVLLYYDRRVRSEALDVRMATERLALAGD